MDVDTLGSLGEFIGSIAVLVTLIYLAYQTTQNNRAIRQRTHSDVPRLTLVHPPYLLTKFLRTQGR
jgi:hypothetical protein